MSNKKNLNGLGSIFRMIGGEDKKMLVDALAPYLSKLDEAVNITLRKKQEQYGGVDLTYNIELLRNPKNKDQTKPVIALQQIEYKEIDGKTVRVLGRPLETSSMKEFVEMLILRNE